MMYWLYLVAVPACAVAFHLRFRQRAISSWIPLVLGTLVAFKGALEYRPDVEIALMPGDRLLDLQPALIYLLGSIFLLTAACTYTARRERIAVTVLAGVVYAYGAWALLPLGLPDRFGDDRTASAGRHCRQSTLYTCGPTACLIALGYFQVQVSERRMATACLTTNRGTTMVGAYRGLRVVGGEAVAVRVGSVDAEALMRPGQVSVVQSGNHMVCLVGAGDGAVLHDPLHEQPGEWSREDIEDRVSHIGILLQPVRRSP